MSKKFKNLKIIHMREVFLVEVIRINTIYFQIIFKHLFIVFLYGEKLLYYMNVVAREQKEFT